MIVAPILCYVAGPYRDPRGTYYVERNIRAAEAIGAKLWQHGIPALIPHCNTRHLDGIAPDQVFLDGDLLMLSRCDVLVLAPNWEQSAGTRAEIVFAEAKGIPVIDSTDPFAFGTWLRENASIAQTGGAA